MFSTRPQFGSANDALQAAAGRLSGLLAVRGSAGAVLANPWIAAAGAGVLFLLAVAGLIAATGDPRAGAPHVHVALNQGPDHPLAAGEAPLTPVTGPAAPALPPTAILALSQSPAAGLTAPGPGGLLPIIAADGRTPAQVYARPFHDTGAPKVALVIGGLGLNAKTTRDAIQDLPAEVTLSFVPYAEGLQGWIDLARANGHEVLLETPMEPLDYPQNDPGPYTLMAQDPPRETVKRLEAVLSRATGYFGVTNYLGGRFMTSDSAMAAFASALHQRGLGFIDDGSAAGRGGTEPRASAERVIDQELDGASIDQQLAGLEASAQQHGKAMASGFAYPVTLQEVQRWAMGLQAKGVVLAPASALMSRRAP